MNLDKLIFRYKDEDGGILEAHDGENHYVVEPDGYDQVILIREGETVRLRYTDARFEVVE